MRRAALLGLGLGVLCTVSTAPVWALGGGDNAAATRTFLRAAYRFDHAILANLQASRTAVTSLVAEVGGCPKLLAHAPRGESLRTLEEEVKFAPVVEAYSPDRRALAEVLRAIEPLHWNNREVNRLFGAEVTTARWFYRAPLPDVCTDVRAWVASGFRQLSPGTTAFVDGFGRLGRVEADPKTLHQLLARWEGPRDRRLARRLHKLRVKDRFEFPETYRTAAGKMLNDLGASH